jgi:hypothetical protein
MIRPLRTWHQHIVFTLAGVLPVVFVGGLAARREPAPANPSVSWDSGAPTATGWRDAAPFRLGRVRRSADNAWIELRLSADALQPDLLVYLSAGPPGGRVLPPDARLVGALPGGVGPHRFPIGGPAGQARGHVIVYSLAHQTMAGSIRLENLP